MDKQDTWFDPPEPERRSSPQRSSMHLRAGAVVALAVAAGVITWLLVARSSPSSSSPNSVTTTTLSTTSIAPVALTAARLRAMAKTLGGPVYWAGPKKGYRYELRRTTNGDIYVRYLPRGVKAGAAGSGYLIVATYPYPNAINALEAVAQRKAVNLSGGGIVLVDSSDPKSVHLAFPRVAYEIEVYDPRPSVSRAIALSGHVRPAR